MSSDMKQITGKPSPSTMDYDALVHVMRVYQGGARKYHRGNYLRSAQERADELALPTPDESRLAHYADAALRHLMKLSTPANRRADEQITRQEFLAAHVDPDSGHLHLAHAACSCLMALQQAIDAGLFPADPEAPLRMVIPGDVHFPESTQEVLQRSYDEPRPVPPPRKRGRGKRRAR